jgi:hypothetical protein
MRVAAVVLVATSLGLAEEPETHTIQQAAWLQGCWAFGSGDRTVEETWMPPRGGSMVGMSRTVRKDVLAEYELVVVRERAGRLVYVAHPSGQPSAEFVATAVSANRVVFENPGHDFPQRIGYERNGAQLNAWIEGAKDGRARRVDFAYRRTACPSE